MQFLGCWSKYWNLQFSGKSSIICNKINHNEFINNYFDISRFEKFYLDKNSSNYIDYENLDYSVGQNVDFHVGVNFAVHNLLGKVIEQDGGWYKVIV